MGDVTRLVQQIKICSTSLLECVTFCEELAQQSPSQVTAIQPDAPVSMAREQRLSVKGVDTATARLTLT